MFVHKSKSQIEHKNITLRESEYRREERDMPWKPRQRKDGPISREGTNEEKISVVRASAFEVPALTRFAEMEHYSEAKATDRTSTEPPDEVTNTRTTNKIM